jgi:hypothetical protein
MPVDIPSLKTKLKNYAVQVFGEITPCKTEYTEYFGFLYFWFNDASGSTRTTRAHIGTGAIIRKDKYDKKGDTYLSYGQCPFYKKEGPLDVCYIRNKEKGEDCLCNGCDWLTQVSSKILLE